MKKFNKQIIFLSIINLFFTTLSLTMYCKHTNTAFEIVAIVLLLIINTLYVNELLGIFKEVYKEGVERGKYEIQNSFRKESE